MRIVVVGTIVADSIEHAGGGVTESLGGIAHSVSVMAALGGDRHEIVPLCRAGTDCRARIEAWAGQLDGVSLEAVVWTEAPNPRVRLCYGEVAEAGERVERLRDAPAPLQSEDLRRAGVADATLVNCITGSDCSAALVAAAGEGGGRLYLDVHSLALGRAADGRRFYRERDDWPAWLGPPGIVQCNRAEAATICGLSRETAPDKIVAAIADRLAAAARGTIRPAQELTVGVASSPQAAMPAVWLLTLGADGAVVMQRVEDDVAVTRIPATTVEEVDPTGAGDAFGAGFVVAWLAGADPVTAAQSAVRAATAATMVRGAPTPAGLRDALQRVAAAS